MPSIRQCVGRAGAAPVKNQSPLDVSLEHRPVCTCQAVLLRAATCHAHHIPQCLPPATPTTMPATPNTPTTLATLTTPTTPCSLCPADGEAGPLPVHREDDCVFLTGLFGGLPEFILTTCALFSVISPCMLHPSGLAASPLLPKAGTIPDCSGACLIPQQARLVCPTGVPVPAGVTVYHSG